MRISHKKIEALRADIGKVILAFAITNGLDSDQVRRQLKENRGHKLDRHRGLIISARAQGETYKAITRMVEEHATDPVSAHWRSVRKAHQRWTTHA